MIDNTNNTGHEPEILAVFMCMILSCFGSIVKEMSNLDTCFNAKRFFANLLCASFSGMIIGCFVPDFDHKNWLFAAAGVAGLAGPAIFDYFINLFKIILIHFTSLLVGHKITQEDIELAKSIRKINSKRKKN